MNAQKKPSLRPAHFWGFVVLSAVTLLGFASPFIPPPLLNGIEPLLESAASAPLAPVVAILLFCLCASLGAPQIVLITAIVAVFGPWLGLVYSWSGKMLACALGFFVGRRFGAEALARHAGPRLTALMNQLARRGFLVSALIRMAPTIPSVLINIAAGATPMRFRDFILGTALGSVPKMALMAFGGDAAMTAMRQHSHWAWAALGVIALVWIALAMLARRWLKRVGPNPSL